MRSNALSFLKVIHFKEVYNFDAGDCGLRSRFVRDGSSRWTTLDLLVRCQFTTYITLAWWARLRSHRTEATSFLIEAIPEMDNFRNVYQMVLMQALAMDSWDSDTNRVTPFEAEKWAVADREIVQFLGLDRNHVTGRVTPGIGITHP
jgi:hypothetical protein